MTDRRDFLQRVALGAVAFAGPGFSREERNSDLQLSRFTFGPTRTGDAWVKRLTSKHRAVFDSPEVGDGAVFDHAAVYLRDFADLDASPTAAQAVIVARYVGVAIAFGDPLWQKYDLVAAADQDSSPRPERISGNPFLHQLETAQKSVHLSNASIEGLRVFRTIFLCCDIAALGMAGRIARRTGQQRDAVYEEIRTNLVPGFELTPSGIFALTRAQEAGCAYVRSS